MEWIDFVRVKRLPLPGEIVHAVESWQEPGGGGAVAAVQLARMAGGAVFFTALSRDDLGRRAATELKELGLELEIVTRAQAQRRAITFIDENGERTITVLGERSVPVAADSLAWEKLNTMDAVFVTGGDAAAVRMARQARVLVATSRIVPLLREAGVQLDALVGSAADPAEKYTAGDLSPEPRLVVRTNGGGGGTFETGAHAIETFAAAPLPGPIADTYGAGDSFAAALTFGLGSGLAPDAAVALAAKCGAAVLMGKGPYRGQLTAADLRL